MDKSKFKVCVGLLLVVGIPGLLMLALHSTRPNSDEIGPVYAVQARFDDIGGLKLRSHVTMAGVKIGRVSAIQFDNSTYEAVVTFSIEDQYDRIPNDSAASVLSMGLFGEKYVGLEVGAGQVHLRDGDVIRHTQSAMILEKLVGQFLYHKAMEGS